MNHKKRLVTTEDKIYRIYKYVISDQQIEIFRRSVNLP